MPRKTPASTSHAPLQATPTRRLTAFGTLCLLGLFGLFALQACQQQAPTPDPEPDPDEMPTNGDASAAAFANAINPPDSGWTGPVFELSHDYPSTDPGACPPEVCTWLSIGTEADFNGTEPVSWDSGPWADYIGAILDYVKDGQDLSSNVWNVDVGSETRWFHVPWMAFDLTRGREFIHGFTNERTAHLSDFTGQVGEGEFETWAFGVYNPWGGYAIGQGWPSSGMPSMTGEGLPSGLPFPEGTLVTKLLFTTANDTQVPYLVNSPSWMANRHVQVNDSTFTCDREPAPVQLVQMDVAVVDHRSPTNWVYGTFAYNGTIDDPDPWNRMSAVGLQWGSDPGAWPAVADTTTRPVESVLQALDIHEHEGCAWPTDPPGPGPYLDRRLDGPVDNPVSSCMACHGGAYAYAADNVVDLPPIFGFDTLCQTHDTENENYFANHVYPEPYPGGGYPGTFPLDTSLQLQVAFVQYAQYANNNGQPKECSM